MKEFKRNLYNKWAKEYNHVMLRQYHILDTYPEYKDTYSHAFGRLDLAWINFKMSIVK